MKTQNPIWTGLLFVALLTFTCCEDDKPCQDPSLPECENYDPCLDERVVDAEFEMSYLAYSWWGGGIWDFDFESKGAEGLRVPWNGESEYDYLFEGGDIWIPSDTAVNDNSATYIRCEASHPNAQSYRWRVGAEGHDREGAAIQVTFGSEGPPPSLDIRLTVEDTAFVDCPGTGSIVQNVQTMTFVEDKESALIGRWKGNSTQYPGETRILEIKKRPFLSDSTYVLSGLLEYSEDCPTPPDGGEHGLRLKYKDDIGYLHAQTDSSGTGAYCSRTINGSAGYAAIRLFPDGVLRIIYGETFYYDDEKAYFLFEGRRIP